MSDEYKVQKVQLNKIGVRELLQSDKTMNVLKANADKVGNGEIYAEFVGFDRCHVLVRDTNDN